jgi:hypothetical protein
MAEYDLWIEPEVHRSREILPGNFRQQIKNAIDDFASDPRPAKTRPLDLTGIDIPTGIELRRLRLDPADHLRRKRSRAMGLGIEPSTASAV